MIRRPPRRQNAAEMQGAPPLRALEGAAAAAAARRPDAEAKAAERALPPGVRSAVAGWQRPRAGLRHITRYGWVVKASNGGW